MKPTRSLAIEEVAGATPIDPDERDGLIPTTSLHRGGELICQYIGIDISRSWRKTFRMSTKSQQLQIRVTPRQKAALKRSAAAAGVDVSTYVLSRILPPEHDRFAEILRALLTDASRRFALAELNDYLHACAPVEFSAAVAQAPPGGLSPLLRNYVAAMVEQAAGQKNVSPPMWVRDVAPLTEPYFATPLKSLRPHLLRAAPIPFKRRNIFVDASVGARV